MSHESMKGNKNAEKWTFEEADKFFQKAISLAKQKEDYVVGKESIIKGFSYHFLGEIASEMCVYLDLFTYLIEKFPDLQKDYKQLKTRLESNCFADSKKGVIKEATAIMNLKSNYGWTDRNDHTTQGEKISNITVGFTENE